MPTLEIGKSNSGFTLIELLVVLIIIGISTSYLMLNSNVINIFQASDNSAEKIFQKMSDESVLKGRTLHWFLNNKEERIYQDDYQNNEPFIQSLDLKFLDSVSSDSEIIILTAQGMEYRIDEDFTPVPMISFYPSGETSGAIITIQNTKLTYKIAVKTNGEIAKIKE